MRHAATVALQNALTFAHNNFSNDSERNYIMQIICEGTLAGAFLRFSGFFLKSDSQCAVCMHRSSARVRWRLAGALLAAALCACWLLSCSCRGAGPRCMQVRCEGMLAAYVLRCCEVAAVCSNISDAHAHASATQLLPSRCSPASRRCCSLLLLAESSRIRQASWECLACIASGYYDKLPAYMQASWGGAAAALSPWSCMQGVHAWGMLRPCTCAFEACMCTCCGLCSPCCVPLRLLPAGHLLAHPAHGEGR